MNMCLTAEQREKAREYRLFCEAWIRMFEREERLHRDRVREQWGDMYHSLTPPRSDHQPTHHKSAPQEGKV